MSGLRLSYKEALVATIGEEICTASTAVTSHLNTFASGAKRY